MIVVERWVVATLVSLGLATAVGAASQSPTRKTQEKQQAQPAPELPPWDSAQPPPPIRPPSPEDAASEKEDYPPPPEEATPDDPTPPVKSTQQPEAPPPPPPAAPQEAAKPVPPAEPAPQEEAATLPPSTDPAQRRMEQDTADLLRLVRELKAEVNKAGSNTLSVIAVEKTEQIQKLVKSLKEQMRERGLLTVNKP
jgi:hypothetical protein